MTPKDCKRAIKKLKSFAGEMEIPVRYYPGRLMDGVYPGMLGAYLNTTDMIVLRRSLSLQKSIYILAHEIGHAIEWHSLRKSVRRHYMGLYGALEYFIDKRVKIPSLLMKFVLERERVAFELGDETLEELRIDFPKKEAFRLATGSMRSFKRLLASCGR